MMVEDRIMILKRDEDGFEAPAAPCRPIRSGQPLFEGGFAPFIAL